MEGTGYWLVPKTSKVRGPYSSRERALSRQAQKVAKGQVQYRDCSIVQAGSQLEAQHEATKDRIV